MTEYFDVTLGVGQGDPGSTSVFVIYIDDLLEELHSRPEDTKLSLGDDVDTYAADLTFADDVNALSLLHNGLQGHVHVIDKWLCNWRLDPNVSKSKHMVMNPGAWQLASDTPGIELHGQRVERIQVSGRILPARRRVGPTFEVCTLSAKAGMWLLATIAFVLDCLSTASASAPTNNPSLCVLPSFVCQLSVGPYATDARTL